MTAFDEPRTLNTDALLATIYSIQTDLKLLTEQLARDRQNCARSLGVYAGEG